MIALTISFSAFAEPAQVILKGSDNLKKGLRIRLDARVLDTNLSPRSRSGKNLAKALNEKREKDQNLIQFLNPDGTKNETYYVAVQIIGNHKKCHIHERRTQINERNSHCFGYIPLKDIKIYSDGTMKLGSAVQLMTGEAVATPDSVATPMKPAEKFEEVVTTPGKTEADHCATCIESTQPSWGINNLKNDLAGVLDKLDKETIQNQAVDVSTYEKNYQDSCQSISFESLIKTAKEHSQKYQMPAELVLGMIGQRTQFKCGDINPKCDGSQYAQANPLSCFSKDPAVAVENIYKKLDQSRNFFYVNKNKKQGFETTPKGTEWREMPVEDQDKFKMILTAYYSNDEYVSQTLKFMSQVKDKKGVSTNSSVEKVENKDIKDFSVYQNHKWDELKMFFYAKELQKSKDKDYVEASKVFHDKDNLLNRSTGYVTEKISNVDSITSGPKAHVNVWSEYLNK